MLIKGGKKDYYDGAQSFGHDAEVMYVRNPQTYWKGPRHEIPRLILQTIEKANPIPSVDQGYLAHGPVFIGFCGKMWVTFPLRTEVSMNYCYTLEQVERVLVKHEEERSNRDGARLGGKTHREEWESDYNSRFQFPFSKKAMTKFISEGRAVTDVGPQLFRELKAPIWVFRRELYTAIWSLEVNPQLKDLNFAAMVPPLEAFNLIERYLSTDLVDQRPPPVSISDEMQAQKKGFDDKSFRNISPGPRKARRSAK